MQSIARIGLAPRRLRIKILTTRWMMTSIFFGATRADELILRCYGVHPAIVTGWIAQNCSAS